MDKRLKDIQERLDKATPDLDFFVSLGGQMCANFPRGLWADEQQTRDDTIFHSHSHEDIRYLLADNKRLEQAVRSAFAKGYTEGHREGYQEARDDA